jgi:diguanylate cyclase (GGDEF)-like protein
MAEKVLENVRGLKLPHPASQAAEFVTVSIGVTTGRVAYRQNWENYVKRADEALYLSKQNGRNRYTFLAFA